MHVQFMVGSCREMQHQQVAQATLWLHELPSARCKLAGWPPYLQQTVGPPPERPLRTSIYVDEVRQGSLRQDLEMPARDVFMTCSSWYSWRARSSRMHWCRL